MAPYPRCAGYLPLVLLPSACLVFGNRLPPWAFMWLLAFSIYAGVKWQSWWSVRQETHAPAWRSAAYLLAWPGMDARAFLDEGVPAPPPKATAWIGASVRIATAVTLLWVIARRIPPSLPLLQGWTGMVGAILILHFGIFRVLALFWQSRGVHAVPIMSSPLLSQSVGEFWGKRWNLGFHQLAHDLIFVPLRRNLGPVISGFTVFLVSGLVHDLVISVPARGGFGLPTLYFVLQGIGVAIERSRLGKSLALRRGAGGWCFMALFVAGPAFWLFHPAFVQRVILPFMEAIHAL